MMSAVSNALRSFLLLELGKGLFLTLKYFLMGLSHQKHKGQNYGQVVFYFFLLFHIKTQSKGWVICARYWFNVTGKLLGSVL